MKKEIYICVDAGGTTSKAGIFLDDKLIFRGIGGPGSPAVSMDKWYLHIDEAIENSLSKLDNSDLYHIKKIAIGLSGKSALTSLEKEIKYFENKYQTICDITSDTLTALYSVINHKDENGIVVISGTGIAIYGKNQDSTCLIGGWGHIIRERGSAYSIVHDFCVNLIDKYEALIPYDELEQGFLDTHNIKNIRELNPLFYQHSKDEIASLSSYFKVASKQNNVHASSLLEREGKNLAVQVENLMKHLKLENGTKIGLKGGFIEKDGELVVSGFKEYMKSKNIYLDYIENDYEQLIGVYRFAKWH